MQTPDLEHDGIAADNVLLHKPIVGTAFGEEVLLVRDHNAIFATSSKCTHYDLPLKDGRIFNGKIICPFHQSCFRLSDGEIVRTPGLAPLKSYGVIEKDKKIFVTRQKTVATSTAKGRHPASVSIVGAGAAGFATLVGLRHAGYEGPITLFGAESEAPYDRVKLSKGYLAGGVSDEKLKLASRVLDKDEGTRLRFGATVKSIDLERRTLSVGDDEHPFHTLVLALGATPRTPDIDGSDKAHVFVLRTLKDAKSILKAIGSGKKRIAIVGAGFIGLEAAAQLRQKEHDVHVIAPQAPPLAHIVGIQLSQEIERTYQKMGVVMHLKQTVTRIGESFVQLSDNTKLEADMVLLAMGVEPNVRLAKQANLEIGDGILVDEHLKTTAKDVFAVGDCASFPLNSTGLRARIEHWASATEMGYVAADNILGHARSIDHVPFFWSEQFDMKLRYVGHCRQIERSQVFGDLKARKAAVALYQGGHVRAVLTLGRDDLAMLAHEAFANGATQKLIEQLSGAF